ncbi:MAG: hypothetical protein ACK559_06240, partial [bacterium]
PRRGRRPTPPSSSASRWRRSCRRCGSGGRGADGRASAAADHLSLQLDLPDDRSARGLFEAGAHPQRAPEHVGVVGHVEDQQIAHPIPAAVVERDHRARAEIGRHAVGERRPGLRV